MNTKINFLLLAAFWFSPCMAIEEGKLTVETSVSSALSLQNEEKNKWYLLGDFSKINEPAPSGMNRQFRIRSTLHRNFIEEILMLGYTNGNIAIWVSVEPDHKNRVLFNNLQNFDWKGMGYLEGIQFNSQNKDKLGGFLSVFYERNLVSDYVIDTVKTQLEQAGYSFDDFRMNTEKLITLINERMGENATVKYFKDILDKELAKIKDSSRRQQIIWEIVQHLIDNNLADKSLLTTLCQEITDEALSCYHESRFVLANLLLKVPEQGHELSIEEKYHDTFVALLQAKNNPDAEAQLSLLVKTFFKNDRLTTEPVPEELQHLKFTLESYVSLLNLIRKQQLEITALKQSKKNPFKQRR